MDSCSILAILSIQTTLAPNSLANKQIIASGSEIVDAFFEGEGIEDCSDGGPEVFEGPCRCLSEQGFEFREDLLDGVEVG